MNKREAAYYFQQIVGPAILEPLFKEAPRKAGGESELVLRRAYERALQAMMDCPPDQFKIVDSNNLEFTTPTRPKP